MFSAARQISSERYEIHLFSSLLHFKAYMQVHKPRDMRPATQARGRKQQQVSHLNECDYAVMDKQIELECAQ